LGERQIGRAGGREGERNQEDTKDEVTEGADKTERQKAGDMGERQRRRQM
jgi:hypothetical protein